MRKKKVFCEKQPKYEIKFGLKTIQVYEQRNQGRTKATDYRNYTYIKTIPITQIYLFVTQWRAEKGANGATPPGIQGRGIKRVKLQKSHFIELLKIYAFSYVSLLKHPA